MNITMTFEEKIKLYLEVNGYTQAEFAEKMGYDRTTINKWVKGHHKMPIEAVNQFCELVGLGENERQELLELAGHDLSPIIPKCRVQIYLQGEFDSLTPERKATIIDALAGMLKISAQSIEVYSIYKGSIVFDLGLPEDAVKELRHLLQINYANLRLLGVTQVTIAQDLDKIDVWQIKDGQYVEKTDFSTSGIHGPNVEKSEKSISATTLSKSGPQRVKIGNSIELLIEGLPDPIATPTVQEKEVALLLAKQAIPLGAELSVGVLGGVRYAALRVGSEVYKLKYSLIIHRHMVALEVFNEAINWIEFQKARGSVDAVLADDTIAYFRERYNSEFRK
jgi:transcriptional regulator with XRE-family HTH domain